MSRWFVVRATLWGSFMLALAGLVGLALEGTSLANGAAPPRQDTPFCGPQWNLFPGADLGSGYGSLAAVGVVAPNDVWAVGEYVSDKHIVDSLTEHWDGQAWSRVQGHGYLRAIAAAGPGAVWAVGTNTIQRWNGRDWQDAPVVISPTESTYELYGLAVASASDAWAVGSYRYGPRFGNPTRSLALHWDGAQWNPVPVPPDEAQIPLLAVAIAGPDDAWAVGGSRILHWDGTTWRVVPSPTIANPGAFNGLVALAAAGPNDIWAVGGATEYPATPPVIPQPLRRFPIIEHWDGRQWSRVAAPNPGIGGFLTGVAVAGPSDVLAVGSYVATPTSSTQQTFVLHWDGSTWRQVAGLNFDTANNSFTAVAAEGPGSFWAVGRTEYQQYYPTRPLIARYSTSLCWQPTPLPPAPPTTVATPIPTGSPTPPLPPSGLPTTRVADPHLPGVLYFPIVGHSLQGGFRVYWEGHGGLEQFGYPLTEEFHEYDQLKGTDTTVQYFERARFEWHPENRPPYDILLGLLGRTVTAGREAEAPFQPQPAPYPPTWRYFPETGHVIAPELATYWETHGGLPIYGYPISNPFTEVNQADGHSYLVQYFERNRLEYHPELPDPYRVSLGLLGTEVLRRQGWLP